MTKIILLAVGGRGMVNQMVILSQATPAALHVKCLFKVWRVQYVVTAFALKYFFVFFIIISLSNV